MAMFINISWPQNKRLKVATSAHAFSLIHNSLNTSTFVSMIGSDLIVNGLFDITNLVPDVDRYRILSNVLSSHNNCTVCPNNNNFKDILPSQSSSFDKTIVLVIESPHDHEFIYLNNNLVPIAPAQANKKKRGAGFAIENYLKCNILSQISNYPQHNVRIIIANPIQFQTSLFVIHKKGGRIAKDLRNSVWQALWRQKNIRANFFDRLKCYEPDLIINSCTGGQDKRGSLNYFISKFLVQHSFSYISYKTGHPSSVWYRTINGRPFAKVTKI
ncbi:MAG: hypothetical protein JXR69_09255 [Candidatus Delongbacteria bacterium]|nr:hypothetical protein [Candidatus Delongbacteria bacterium]